MSWRIVVFYLLHLLKLNVFLRYNHSIVKTKGTEMTDFESKCYGMSEADIRYQYMNSITARTSGLEMVVMGILSDQQEMLALGSGPRAVEYVRKQMNIAKFILQEMMDARSELA
jgi:hypothetical protein